MKTWKLNLSLLLAITFFANTAIPQNVQASEWKAYKMTVVKAEGKLAKVFDKFRYDMTVEWDQEDPYFREHAEKQLETALLDLKKAGCNWRADASLYGKESFGWQDSKRL